MGEAGPTKCEFVNDDFDDDFMLTLMTITPQRITPLALSAFELKESTNPHSTMYLWPPRYHATLPHQPLILQLEFRM